MEDVAGGWRQLNEELHDCVLHQILLGWSCE